MARILIVDDEDDVRSVLARTLESSGHEVYEASDGLVALQVLSDQDFDLVITDILMPHQEGLETIQAIRMNWPDIKIIAMSGCGRVRNIKILSVAQKFGANVTMQKPFSMPTFTEAVGKLLDQSLWQAK